MGALGAVRKLAVMIGLGGHPADRSPEERVLEKYYDRLLVYPVGRSRSRFTVFSTSSNERPSRSIRHTTTVSPVVA